MIPVSYVRPVPPVYLDHNGSIVYPKRPGSLVFGQAKKRSHRDASWWKDALEPEAASTCSSSNPPRPCKISKAHNMASNFPTPTFFLDSFFCKMKFQSQKLAMAKKLTAFQGNTPRQVGKLARCFSRVTPKTPNWKNKSDSRHLKNPCLRHTGGNIVHTRPHPSEKKKNSSTGFPDRFKSLRLERLEFQKWT